MSRKSSRNHFWELANYTHNVFLMMANNVNTLCLRDVFVVR